jgi:hypothetical protein
VDPTPGRSVARTGARRIVAQNAGRIVGLAIGGIATTRRNGSIGSWRSSIASSRG